jgi:4-alpha-glucanotransferase
MHKALASRHAGALLHVTSLPSGRLDDDALRWLDFMSEAGLSVWQVLPLVIPDGHGSPYQSESAFAMDPRLLPLQPDPIDESEFEAYCDRQAHWLDDFAQFRILKQRFDNQPWTTWPTQYKSRDPEALALLHYNTSDEVRKIKRQQFMLAQAWHRIHEHARERGIALFGDIPIFVAHDSAETWAQPENFLLDPDGQPTSVTGVPPDYFSATGQRWGNPHYRWDRMEADGFRWWHARMRHQFDLFDIVRIDHFRGLVAVWMIDAACDTAMEGHWQETPGDALLSSLQQRYPELPIVAEDLGVITEAVRTLRRKYALPGMAVLQFAFDHFDDNPHKPANITPDDVVYTGTHDNDTAAGWFSTLEPHERSFVFEILDAPPTDDIAALMINSAMQTDANLAIAPLQDLLGLDSQSRMNTPGVTDGNWHWRFHWDMLDDGLASRVRTMVEDSGRHHAS